VRSGKVNANKPDLWKPDIAASVDQFNQWFMRFAPEAFRSTRVKTTEHVKAALLATDDLRSLDAATLRANPGALPTLRMCTAPPLAVDRLIGLASANKSLIGSMEEGKLAARMKAELLDENLTKVCAVLTKLLDRDIFPWLDAGKAPTDHERDRASTIIADRLCGAVDNGIERSARRSHQLSAVAAFLDSIGYREAADVGGEGFTTNEPGTYTIDAAIPLAMGRIALMPVDVLVQPIRSLPGRMPVLVDVASSQDNREAARHADREVRKSRAFQMTYGESLRLVLMLDGHIDAGILGRLAAESLDWVWQHRIAQLAEFFP
jgi:XamI restriction endonuclease